MKKIWKIAVCCMLVGMLMACGSKKDEKKEEKKEETQTTTEKETEDLDTIVDAWNQVEGGTTAPDKVTDGAVDSTVTDGNATDSADTTTPSAGSDDNQKEDTGSAVTSDGWTKDY